MKSEASTLATWSFVLAMVAIALPFIKFELILLSMIAGFSAFVTGMWGFVRIRKAKGALSGTGIALFGAILGLLEFVLLVGIPFADESSIFWGRATTALNNGRNIYASVTRYPTNLWSEDFKSSTAFMRSLVTNGVMKVDYSFFGAPMMPTSDKFTAANNAWCVVASVNESLPEGTPILFTRNINVTNLNEFSGPIKATLSDEAPFGKKVAIVVCVGGMAMTVRPEGTWEERFPGAPFRDHPVLRP